MRFIEKVGKLARLVIHSQDVREARPQSAVLAAAREGQSGEHTKPYKPLTT